MAAAAEVRRGISSSMIKLLPWEPSPAIQMPGMTSKG